MTETTNCRTIFSAENALKGEREWENGTHIWPSSESLSVAWVQIIVPFKRDEQYLLYLDRWFNRISKSKIKAPRKLRWKHSNARTKHEIKSLETKKSHIVCAHKYVCMQSNAKKIIRLSYKIQYLFRRRLSDFIFYVIALKSKVVESKYSVHCIYVLASFTGRGIYYT